MKRIRRTFTQQFKTEVVKAILANQNAKEIIAVREAISVALLDRWLNDYLAKSKTTVLTNKAERRKDYSTVQELKAKIADLYMQLEKFKRNAFHYELPIDEKLSA